MHVACQNAPAETRHSRLLDQEHHLTPPIHHQFHFLRTDSQAPAGVACQSSGPAATRDVHRDSVCASLHALRRTWKRGGGERERWGKGSKRAPNCVAWGGWVRKGGSCVPAALSDTPSNDIRPAECGVASMSVGRHAGVGAPTSMRGVAGVCGFAVACGRAGAGTRHARGRVRERRRRVGGYSDRRGESRGRRCCCRRECVASGAAGAERAERTELSGRERWDRRGRKRGRHL